MSAILLSCAAILSGCSPESIYGLDENAPDPAPEPDQCLRGVHPIENSSDAHSVSFFIKKSIETTVENMPDGTYKEEKVSDAWGGEVTITGIISRVENEPCGTDCLTSYNGHNIVATMSDYKNYSVTTITGIINYSDDTESRYTEDGLSVFGNITISDNGGDISYERVYLPFECNFNDTEIGIIDTIYSITSSWDAEYIYSQNGSLTSTGGTFLID